jgi:hypothetical protein
MEAILLCRNLFLLERFHFLCSDDILVCEFRRLSSRQFLLGNTGQECPVNPQAGKPALHHYWKLSNTAFQRW